MGARARRGAIRFRPRVSRAARAKRTSSSAEASARSAGTRSRAGARDGACARCDETLPAAPAVSECGRCLLDPPAFEPAARRRAVSRSGARHPARVQVPRRGLPRARGWATRCGNGSETATPTRSSPCPRRPARGGRAATMPPAPSPRRWRARCGIDLARDRVVKMRETEVQSRLPLAGGRATCAAPSRCAGGRLGACCSSTTWRRRARRRGSAPAAWPTRARSRSRVVLRARVARRRRAGASA